MVTILEQLLQYNRQYGPLPSNWNATDDGGFVSRAGVETKVYPMSPQGRQAGAVLEPSKDSPQYRKLAGTADGPYLWTYKPADWIWVPNSDTDHRVHIQRVLHDALAYSGAKNHSGGAITEQDVKDEFDKAGNYNQNLYNPHDRSKDVAFNFEGLAALVARNFKRSLWVICPQFLKLSKEWEAVYHHDNNKRMYCHLRFSSGQQGDYSPAVVGLLPVPKKPSHAHWYFMKPAEHFKDEWQKLYVNPTFDFKQLATQLGYNGAPLFIVAYALMACHRTQLLVPKTINVEKLAEWISQYIGHLAPQARNSAANAPFQFSSSKSFKGQKNFKIDQRQLDAWVIAAKDGEVLRLLANRWDAVMTAKIRYESDSNLVNYRDMLEAQQALARLRV